MKKEDVYIDLRGKSKEELTEFYNFLESVGEKMYDSLEKILEYYKKWNIFSVKNDYWILSNEKYKQEVTIEQLKEILQPMETKFTPTAMKCTQEQFEAIKPKLKGCEIKSIGNFNVCNYLVNNLNENGNVVSNISESLKWNHNRVVHEQWNEEIFLKACGIEVETLEQQLEKAIAEVERIEQEIEESKIKIGDWVISELNDCVFRYQYGRVKDDLTKITDQELIKKLNNLIK